MVISPNSTIKILSNVKLKPDLKHTFLFGSAAAQSSYFSSLTTYTLNAQSYQRSYTNKMRIEKAADDLYNCNYLMFQNTAFGSKWFYAFITDIEYINNVTSEITYELDPLQTYLFEGELNPCFVERQHAEFDEIGLNIVPEPVDLGEYVYSSRTDLTALDDMVIILAVCDTALGLQITMGSYDGVFSGFDLWAFSKNNITGVIRKINDYSASPEKVQGLYMVPAYLLGDIGFLPTTGKQLCPPDSSGFQTSKLTYYISKPTGIESFEMYTNVKNKKLYTYPYNYLMISNNCGSSLNLRYEKFSNSGAIEIEGSIIPPVKTVLRPKGYKGSVNASSEECITLESYPECSWANDAYSIWKAQNSVPIAINAASGVAQAAIVGAVSGFNPLALATSGISAVSNLLKENYSASIAADQCRGNTNSSNVNAMHSKQHFVSQRAHIQADYAKSIDDFFTIYGYAQKKIMTPNRNARPEYTFIKTNGSNVTGNIPAEFLQKINNAYDNGITFWNNPAHIYNYNVDNSPYDY